MNRRDLIRRGPFALLGIAGAAVGIKANDAQPDSKVAAHEVIVRVKSNDSQIVKAFADNYNSEHSKRVRSIIINS